MKINGWDVSNAKAKQARFTNGHHSLSNDSSWNEGSSRPIFQRNQMGFKPFTIELWVKGDDYQEIVENRGTILSHLIDPAKIEIDGNDHLFYGILDKYDASELSKDWLHVLKLEFVGYEYAEKQEYTVDVSATFSITNIGTAPTPVRLEIIPKGGPVDIPEDQMIAYVICDDDGKGIADSEDGAVIASHDYNTLVISGLSRDTQTGEALDIEIRNTTPGKTISIDGETGLILEDGAVKIDDVDIWSLPTLQPGENVITTNNNWLGVAVHYNPRFM